MLSIREALEQMLPHFRPLGTERVPLLQAHGRVLAESIVAAEPLPPFDNSAMDGYAVRLADVREREPLRVSGESRAGGIPQPLAAGTAQRILTGAPMPEGADTVVMQESTERNGDQVVIVSMPRAAANVRRAGSECERGTRLLDDGALLGPGEIGLLASQNRAQVELYRRPRVAILPTGDELRALGEPARDFSIVDTNTYALAAAVESAGCVPIPLSIARDDLASLSARIAEGLHADMLITVGGVSVGEYDFVAEAMRAAGVNIVFHKVAIKPGKPLLFGTHGATTVVGLPGNPVSAVVTFEVFVRPGLLRLQGLRDAFSEPIEVVLAEPYQHKAGRTEFVRARLQRGDGVWLAHVHATQSSGALTSLASASALVAIPAQRTRFEAGERLPAILLGLPRRRDTPFDA